MSPTSSKLSLTVTRQSSNNTTLYVRSFMSQQHKLLAWNQNTHTVNGSPRWQTSFSSSATKLRHDTCAEKPPQWNSNGMNLLIKLTRVTNKMNKDFWKEVSVSSRQPTTKHEMYLEDNEWNRRENQNKPYIEVKKCSTELLEKWRLYFEALLNVHGDKRDTDIPPADCDLPISTDNFTLQEVRTALKSLSNAKAPGCDTEICAEALKYGWDTLQSKLISIWDLVLHKGKAPSEWTQNLILPKPKKGDIGHMENYDGISLMSVAAKLYHRMLLSQIHEHLDNTPMMNQAGFRQSRDCWIHTFWGGL